MSISVLCEECDKTYQVRDEMAGRRGKCPRGHSIVVPAMAAPVEENAFAFTADGAANRDNDDEPAPKTARRKPARRNAEPEPEPAPAADDFSFPTPSLIGNDRDEEPAPKTGRHRRPEPKAAGGSRKESGKPSLMPLILGGILAVLGIGGGTTLLIVSRGEAGPLKVQAEEANKKAAAAEERAQKAESLKLLAESNLEAARKSPPKDPALAEAQKQLKAEQKKNAELAKAVELQKGKEPAGGGETAAMPAKDLDPTAPGGKADPVMPSGKLDNNTAAKKDPGKPAADMPDGIPLGGKNWTAPGSIPLGANTLKAGDRLWLWPQEDVAVKAAAGKVTIKFRWQLRKGKELPPKLIAFLIVQEAKAIKTFPTAIALTGANGEMEVVFDHKELKDIKGSLPTYFFVGEGVAANPTVHSSMMNFQADFSPAAAKQ